MFRRIVSGIMLTLLLISMLTLGAQGVVHDACMHSPAQQIPHETIDRIFINQTGGPRMESLYIKYFENDSALFDALKNGEVDITDMDLTQAHMDQVFNDTNIQAAISSSSGIFQFDFNNNDTIPTYPNWTSPTAYKEFRQGIACLVNKTRIINEIVNYSYRIDTPIPRPNGDWWVDWDVSQYDPYGDLLGNYPYEYNSSAAASYFDLGGFVEGNITSSPSNPYYDPSFSGSAQYLRLHPETNRHLEPLIFYMNDDPRRLEAGRILRDNLRKMGIPVNATETSFPSCFTKVMQERDYHIYTGGWSLGNWAASSLHLYSSEYIGNYLQFRNATYDEWVRIAVYPSDLVQAREAALESQKILVEEAVGVWLWSPSRVMGYRNIYGIVNSRGERIDNRWTFLNARSGVIGTTGINYGLRSSPASLNVVTDYSSSLPEGNCLDRIYDTLLSYCPYDETPGNVYGEGDRGGTMPWMAEDWEIEAWESPYDPGENLTKLTFYLRESITWHDGAELNSTDVKFTIDYIQGLGSLSSLYSKVSDVHHVTTLDARTVVVYENVSNVWTLDAIGALPILPKHIFQSIANVTGYTPGASEGHPANQTLIGSGAWKYFFHNSSMLWLEANRNYFMETPPEAEIDFRYDWEMESWVVDAMDATMVGEAYGSTGYDVPDAKWEPGSDIARGDCQVDMFDVLTLAQGFNATWGKSAKRYIVTPPTDTAIYIEPLENPIVVCENLTVYVKLKDLTRLSGIQFKLNYDNTKLDCLELTIAQVFGGSTFEAKKEINQTKGFVWVSISSIPSQQVSGNTTLATITFNATKPSGSMLDLWNTKFASYGAPGSTCQLVTHQTVDRGVMVGVSTSTGTNVTVAPAENANVTFAETTTEGVTTLNITQAPSTEFVSVLCHDIQTTANYTGNMTIQFAYDPTGLSLEDEQSMKIWLWNDSSGSWVDITTFVDTDNNIIHGVTSHLSVFGVTCDLNIGFEETVAEGETTVRVTETAPDPPPGLVALNYYVIETTTMYTGPVNIRLAYDGNAVPPEEEIFIQIWLWNDSSESWVDITTFVDTDNNIIHGVTSHLSVFGVTIHIPPPMEIIVMDATVSKTVVGQEYSVTINFTVENQGDFTETFDVVVYGNSTTLATYPATLSPAAQIALSFTWNTTGWAKGNYSINTLAHLISWVVVTIPGDVDGDFDVDIFDIVRIATIYMVSKPDPLYDPNADLDDNGLINIFDVVAAARNYGQKYP